MVASHRFDQLCGEADAIAQKARMAASREVLTGGNGNVTGL